MDPTTWTAQVARLIGCFALAALAALSLGACGGDAGATPETAACMVERSELGPFSPTTALGKSMTEEQARAQMAQHEIVDWLAVTGEGPWDQYWDTATATLGQSIHLDLTWLDINGEIRGLYRPDDAFAFDDLRVSRSFQGKIEHADEPIYLPLQDVGQDVNFEASCHILGLEFGDAINDQLLDVFEPSFSS